jgi:hypothetical protein
MAGSTQLIGFAVHAAMDQDRKSAGAWGNGTDSFRVHMATGVYYSMLARCKQCRANFIAFAVQHRFDAQSLVRLRGADHVEPVSKLTRGSPFQFMRRKENIRCSILFYLLGIECFLTTGGVVTIVGDHRVNPPRPSQDPDAPAGG